MYQEHLETKVISLKTKEHKEVKIDVTTCIPKLFKSILAFLKIYTEYKKIQQGEGEDYE